MSKVFTAFRNLFNVLNNILPVLRFLWSCGWLKVCEVTGGDLKRKSILKLIYASDLRDNRTISYIVKVVGDVVDHGDPKLPKLLAACHP